MYINGAWLETERILEVKNPANGQAVDQVFLVGKEETKQAIEAAKNAFPSWSGLTGEQRGAYLHKVVERLEEKKEHFAQTITKEMGKSIHNARYEVGNTIAFLIRQSADTVKRVSMEIGGHAPFIVFEDADIDLAIEGAISSKFSSTGQQCVCTNRIYVHDSIYDTFASRFADKVSSMRIGDGLDENTQLGPLVNKEGVDKANDHVTDAAGKGARILCGGKVPTGNEYKNGHFYLPTVLADVNEEMKITYEETFGPVAPLIRFSNEDEVVAKANNIEYGLASYFYTNDLSRVHRVSEKLEYGMVGVNDPAPFAVQTPFGGVKESGLGREGGKYGLEDYLETKLVSVAIQSENQ